MDGYMKELLGYFIVKKLGYEIKVNSISFKNILSKCCSSCGQAATIAQNCYLFKNLSNRDWKLFIESHAITLSVRLFIMDLRFFDKPHMRIISRKFMKLQTC